MIYALIVADLLMLAVFGFSFNHLPPQIPMFYTRPWGEDQLADLWLMILIPVLLHAFFFLNIWLQKRFFSRDVFMQRLFTYFNWFLIVSYLAIFLKIMLLVL